MGRRPKQIFLKRSHTDGQETHKKCSTPPIIIEMQITTTKQYHPTPVRKIIIKKGKKSTNNICWRLCG